MDTLFKKPPEAYWIASTPQPNFPKLEEDVHVDVAIVGGGIAGILAAYFLSQNGMRIAVLEASKILKGTTGHTTAKITSQHGLLYSKITNYISKEFAQQYANANETAISMYHKMASELNIDCDLLAQSAYIYTHEDRYISKIAHEVEDAASLGINATYLEEIPLPFSVKAAVRFDGQAAFHPRKFLLPLVDVMTKKGVDIYEGSPIVSIDENETYVLRTRDAKKVFAEKVIIASHYPFFNKHGMYFSRLYPERSYVVAITAKEKYPDGMYITAEDPGRSFRSQPSDHGELILIGGEHHKTGQGEEMNKHYETLVSFAKETYTIEDIHYRWSTQDCMTMDGLPFVGHYTSETPNLYVTTGFGKWGMTNSMVSAMLLRDLIVTGKSDWQDVYNPSRETLMSSAKNFVVENLNVAKQLISGKLDPVPTEVTINPGEGKIVEVNDDRSGAFRDEKGTLHIVNTTCTHMGCEVKWNSAERTWDCPCHGSRFTTDGEVVEGPAVHPLDKDREVNTLTKLIKEDF